MLDCADADLLGSVEDRGAYLQPKRRRLGRAVTRANRLPVVTTTYLTAPRTQASALHSRAILPLPIQNTGLSETSIEEDKKVARLDTRSAFELKYLSIELRRQAWILSEAACSLSTPVLERGWTSSASRGGAVFFHFPASRDSER